MALYREWEASLPMRGEWIEIDDKLTLEVNRLCLSPCGESGLKSEQCYSQREYGPSLPMRGEWIEITKL